MSDRRLVLVVGVGRSGTSLLAGVLSQLGFHIPQPEVQADETNPRGFGEPRWVVDFHMKLLRRRLVTVNDSRPAAWDATWGVDDAETVATARDWLAGQLREGEAIVVKDPRTVWFLPLWVRAARELGVAPSFVTMLRHPAEVLTSARKSYGDWQGETSRAAAWINVALETEHGTRGDRRAFVRYDDLLADWQTEVTRVGQLLDLPLLRDMPADRVAAVDEFVDPTLHRNRVTWEDVDVAAPVRDLAERAWHELLVLTQTGGDAPSAHAALDATRDEFRALYAEAEAIAQSSINAARRQRRGAGGRSAPAPLRVRLARRIPVQHRKRLRRVLTSLKG